MVLCSTCNVTQLALPHVKILRRPRDCADSAVFRLFGSSVLHKFWGRVLLTVVVFYVTRRLVGVGDVNASAGSFSLLKLGAAISLEDQDSTAKRGRPKGRFFGDSPRSRDLMIRHVLSGVAQCPLSTHIPY